MKKVLMVLSLVSVFLLAACSNTNTESEQEESKETVKEEITETSEETDEAKTDKKQTIVVGTNGPHLDIMNKAKEIMDSTTDYEMELKVFDDIIQPNVALDEGSIDCNFFQHRPYLAAYNEQHGTNLQEFNNEGVFMLQFGFYSKSVDSIDQIPDGGQIVYGNDPSNRAIALKFLQELGLIKLEDGVEQPDTTNIVDNPKNLRFTEVDVTSVVNSIEDPEVSGAIVMGFALARSGKDPSTAITYASQDLTGQYVNVLACREEDQGSEALQAVFDVLTGEEMAKFYDQYFKGAVKLLD